jgi:sulfide:quinone oxidoreductase
MDRRPQRIGAPSRRDILAYGGGALAAAVLASGVRAAPVRTSAHIVIAGGGAAGLAIASRLSRMLEGASITIVEPNREHRFQPGYTLVYAGVWQPSKVVTKTAAYVPTSVRWLEAEVTEIDPEAKSVKVSTGDSLRYDFLVVATGLRLDYRAIEGMDESLIGKEGIGSIFAGPEAAAASSRAFAAYAEKGGVALFGRPATEMKCAGAPLKVTFLADYFLRRQGNRSAARIAYLAHSGVVFAVKPVNERVSAMFAERDIEIRHNQVLRAIDPGKRRATYQTPEGTSEYEYDYIHVVPPMHAPDAVRNSPLPWQEGPNAADGWVEVDRGTLRHLRFPEVFAVGDVAGVPRGKTAASVKWQVPVAAAGIVATIAGTESSERYNGYTSCPLITGVGTAMLIEFDYDGNLTPSFPFIDPLKELWISWFIEEQALKPTYYAMLRGYG